MKDEILHILDQRCSDIRRVINPITLRLQKGEKLVISLQVSFYLKKNFVIKNVYEVILFYLNFCMYVSLQRLLNHQPMLRLCQIRLEMPRA